MTPRTIRRAARAVAVAVFLVYVGAAAWLLLTTDGWAVNRLNVLIWTTTVGPAGLRLPITPEQFSVLGNVLLFIPAFTALALLRPSWWWVLAGAGASGAVELYQYLGGSRDASLADLAANTLGAVLGVGLGLWISRAALFSPEAARSRSRALASPLDRAGPPSPARDPLASVPCPDEAPDDRD